MNSESTDICAFRNPLTPPMIIITIEPMMNLKGIAVRADPGIRSCHRLAIQLNTCSVLGIKMSSVIT